MGLGNSPRRMLVFALEARRSFAFGLQFKHAASGNAADLTGAAVRLVLSAPEYKGGAVLLTKTATAVDLVAGQLRVDLQAADLDHAEAEYPFTITLVTADGYSTPVAKGVFDIRNNPDASTANTYTTVTPTQGLTFELGTANSVVVHIDSLPGERGADGPQGARGFKGDPGDKGDPGTPGATGPANTLSIGTVTAGPTPAASLTGSAPNQVLNLTLVQGPEGPQGVKGDPGNGSVNSVNGDPGPDIVLDYTDVGAASAGHTHPAPSLTLNDLTDVDTAGATTGQAVVRQADGSWKPGNVASSGGVYSSSELADVAPSSPSAYNDEFDGTSSVTWSPTVTAPNAVDRNTTFPGAMYLKASGSGGAYVGRTQPVPGSYPYTIQTKLLTTTARGNNHRGGGILLAPSGYGTGTTIFYFGNVYNNGHTITRVTAQAGGTFSSQSAAPTPLRFPLYLRVVVNSATSISTYFSTNGFIWQLVEANFNPGFTPALMGLVGSEESGATTGQTMECAFDHFRVGLGASPAMNGAAAPAAGSGYVVASGGTQKIYGPITQAAYDALATKDPQTLYVIVG